MIEKAIDTVAGANVFVLANHGLVVCGESCDAAEDLLGVVERRLAALARPNLDDRISFQSHNHLRNRERHEHARTARQNVALETGTTVSAPNPSYDQKHFFL